MHQKLGHSKNVDEHQKIFLANNYRIISDSIRIFVEEFCQQCRSPQRQVPRSAESHRSKATQKLPQFSSNPPSEEPMRLREPSQHQNKYARDSSVDKQRPIQGIYPLKPSSRNQTFDNMDARRGMNPNERHRNEQQPYTIDSRPSGTDREVYRQDAFGGLDSRDSNVYYQRRPDNRPVEPRYQSAASNKSTQTREPFYSNYDSRDTSDFAVKPHKRNENFNNLDSRPSAESSHERYDRRLSESEFFPKVTSQNGTMEVYGSSMLAKRQLNKQDYGIDARGPSQWGHPSNRRIGKIDELGNQYLNECSSVGSESSVDTMMRKMQLAGPMPLNRTPSETDEDWS